MRRTVWMGLALLALLGAWGTAQAANGTGQRINARERNNAIRSQLAAQANAVLPGLILKWGPMGEFQASEIRFRTKKVKGAEGDLRKVTYTITRREGWGGKATAETTIGAAGQKTSLFDFVLTTPKYDGPPPGALSDIFSGVGR